MATRLLIVDDEIPLLRNLSSYLGSFTDEFEVRTASSPQLALDKLEANPDIEVLLTDVRMPGIDGIELVQRALAINRTLRVVVMTAFSTAELRTKASAAGALRYLEKPLDVTHLRRVLLEVAASRSGWTGSLAGLDLFDFIQLFVLSGRSTSVQVSDGDRRGVLVFRQGRLIHASTSQLEGDAAFYEIATWRGGDLRELPQNEAQDHQPNITSSTNHLMMEAARLHDEALHAASSDDRPIAGPGEATDPGDIFGLRLEGMTTNTEKKREETAMAIKDHLGAFEEVEGFRGAAVFTPQGEMLEGLAKAKVDVKTIGMFANNALLNAQKATDQMGVGRGNLLQIRAPQAVVLMRCLNEATDFAATKEGKAHFHTVVVMDPEGNTGMATMILDKVQAKIAEEVR